MKWVAAVFRHGMTLSCVDEKYLDTVINLKVLLSVIDNTVTTLQTTTRIVS